MDTAPGSDLWSIIERVERASRGDLDAACAAFQAELERLDDAALLATDIEFCHAMSGAYDWNVWGAAYVIHGGCSDDGFWDFRAGLVALGRKVYEQALRDPDALAEVEDIAERTLFEGFQYVPGNVLRARGLAEPRVPHTLDRPTGTEWDEKDVAGRYPRLTARFG
jgi:hypothetical protein